MGFSRNTTNPRRKSSSFMTNKLDDKRKQLCPTTTIKIGRDDRYASSVISTKFGFG